MPLLGGLRHSSLIIILALIFVHQQDSVYANKMTSLSFEPPFRDIDNSGLRMVSTGWRTSGATVINNNFVRLTPDQQVIDASILEFLKRDGQCYRCQLLKHILSL